MPLPDLKWMIGNRIREIRLVEPVSWWFRFTSGAIRADSLWRVIKGGGIQATSTDHGHLFGQAHPFDSVMRATDALSSAAVRQASIAGDTGDVIVHFDNDARLEILATSCGYESWSVFFANGDEAIGLGGGKVCLLKRDG